MRESTKATLVAACLFVASVCVGYATMRLVGHPHDVATRYVAVMVASFFGVVALLSACGAALYAHEKRDVERRVREIETARLKWERK